MHRRMSPRAPPEKEPVEIDAKGPGSVAASRALSHSSLVAGRQGLLFLVLLFVGRDDLFGNFGRNVFVVIERHRERSSSRGHRTQDNRIAEHLRERNLRAHDLEVSMLSMPRIRPRRLLKSPMISPMKLSGTYTCTLYIGSSRIGLASRQPFLKAIWLAILNAISEESTAW